MDWDRIAEAVRMDLYAGDVDWYYSHATDTMDFIVWGRERKYGECVSFPFADRDKYSPSKIVNWVVDAYRREFRRLGV